MALAVSTAIWDAMPLGRRLRREVSMRVGEEPVVTQPHDEVVDRRVEALDDSLIVKSLKCSGLQGDRLGRLDVIEAPNESGVREQRAIGVDVDADACPWPGRIGLSDKREGVPTRRPCASAPPFAS